MSYGNSMIRMRAHREPYEVAQDVIRLRRALWECLVLSGADVSDYDGPESWPVGTSTPLEEVAVLGVRDLRAAYDEACEQ